MSTLNIQLLCRRSIDFPDLAIFSSRPGAMINLHWLELPVARTIFHGPKGVRVIEVRLYLACFQCSDRSYLSSFISLRIFFSGFLYSHNYCTRTLE